MCIRDSDGRVLYGDAAPERERNPVNPEPELPEPEPGFSAAAADAAFRENLLAAHETIARSWLALRRLQDDDRRDLSYDAFAAGLELYGVAAATGRRRPALKVFTALATAARCTALSDAGTPSSRPSVTWMSRFGREVSSPSTAAPTAVLADRSAPNGAK